MSDRVIIRQCIIPIIEEHLKDNLEPNTIKMYQQIIDHGVSEERAIELLAFYFEIYVKENFFSDEFDSKKWKKFLDKLTPIYHIPGEYVFDIQEERANLRAIARNYGKIKTDTEKWEDELYVVESHLLVYNELYAIDSYEAKKIINIVINRLFDLKNGYTSDYTDYAHEDILSLADGLEQICNPYANTQLYDYLSKFVDLEDQANFSDIFKSVFIVLAKVLDSIIFHEKKSDKYGYFDFISQFIDVDKCIDEGPVFFFNDHTLEK